MSTNDTFKHHLGSFLVALQFGLIALLARLAWPVVASAEVPPAAWVCIVVGVLVGLWAVSVNRLGNFNIRPAPRAGGTLVQQGPYRWIRHPMYTAVMACGVACAWADASGWAWLVALALVLVLSIKASFEERWMSQVHLDYAEYRCHTWRFVPWLY
jgi:protein-S-isoprenylcysteine O-methyltransferase Ste14